MKKKNRYKLTSNTRVLYSSLLAFIILGFSFFFSSKVLFADKKDILNTEINKEFNVAQSGSFKINEWIYDDKKNKMQLIISTNNLTSYLTDLEFTSVTKLNPEKKLPTKIVYTSNDFYIIHIEKIPKDFEVLSVRINKNEFEMNPENEKNNAEKDNEISKIYADQNLIKRSNINVDDINIYAIEITKKLKESNQIKIDKLNNEIKIDKNIIGEIEKEISKNKTNMIYQTSEEQVDTSNKNYNLQTEIDNMKKEISIKKTDLLSLEKKKEKLNTKIDELQN